RQSLLLGVVEPSLGRLSCHHIADFADSLDLPSHASALIFDSTSVLCASSAAISSSISFGLRCAATFPPCGFFTDRSKVVCSTLSASTAQLFGEPANVCWKSTNS